MITTILIVILIVVLYIYLSKKYEKFEMNSIIERGKKVCGQGKYTPWSLTIPDNDEITKIINTVLQKINLDYNLNYHFSTFDSIVKEYDYDGKVRYLVDFFSIHLDPTKLNNDVNRRFILDVTKIDDKTISVNKLTVGNAKKYGVGITGDSDDPNIPSPDELIISPTLFRYTGNVVGLFNPVVEYETPKYAKVQQTDYNKSILPLELEKEKQLVKVFPCRRHKKWWDTNGVHKIEPDTKTCKGVNSATTPRYNVGEYYVGNLAHDRTKYNWLFDKTRGFVSSTFPTPSP